MGGSVLALAACWRAKLVGSAVPQKKRKPSPLEWTNTRLASWVHFQSKNDAKPDQALKCQTWVCRALVAFASKGTPFSVTN